MCNKKCAIYLGGPGSSQIFDPINLEGTATDAVHLARYSNAAVINPIDNVDRNVGTVIINPMVIDTISVDNNRIVKR